MNFTSSDYYTWKLKFVFKRSSDAGNACIRKGLDWMFLDFPLFFPYNSPDVGQAASFDWLVKQSGNTAELISGCMRIDIHGSMDIRMS